MLLYNAIASYFIYLPYLTLLPVIYSLTNSSDVGVISDDISARQSTFPTLEIPFWTPVCFTNHEARKALVFSPWRNLIPHKSGPFSLSTRKIAQMQFARYFTFCKNVVFRVLGPDYYHTHSHMLLLCYNSKGF